MNNCIMKLYVFIVFIYASNQDILCFSVSWLSDFFMGKKKKKSWNACSCTSSLKEREIKESIVLCSLTSLYLIICPKPRQILLMILFYFLCVRMNKIRMKVVFWHSVHYTIMQFLLQCLFIQKTIVINEQLNKSLKILYVYVFICVPKRNIYDSCLKKHKNKRKKKRITGKRKN